MLKLGWNTLKNYEFYEFDEVQPRQTQWDYSTAGASAEVVSVVSSVVVSSAMVSVMLSVVDVYPSEVEPR